MRLLYLSLMSLLWVLGCGETSQPGVMNRALVVGSWEYTPANATGQCAPSTLRFVITDAEQSAVSNALNLRGTWQEGASEPHPIVGGIIDLGTGDFAITALIRSPLITLEGTMRPDGTATARYFSDLCGSEETVGVRTPFDFPTAEVVR